MDYNNIISIIEQGANVVVSAQQYPLKQLRAMAREAVRKNVMLTVECKDDIFTANELKLLAQEGGRNITILV